MSKTTEQYVAKGIPRHNFTLGEAAHYWNSHKQEVHWNNLHEPDDKTGTLGFLFKQYKQSTYFIELASSTRKDYDGYMICLESIRDMPIAKIDQPFINELRDKTFRQKNVPL